VSPAARWRPPVLRARSRVKSQAIEFRDHTGTRSGAS
jgi:hypothetical protein